MNTITDINHLYGEEHNDIDLNREWANAYYDSLDQGISEPDARNHADDAISNYLVKEGLTR